MNDSSHAPIPPSGGGGLNQRLLSSLEALSRASSYLIAVVGLAVLGCSGPDYLAARQ